MPMKTRLSEFDLIARYFAPLAGEGAFNLLDDAAILDIPPGKRMVVTNDALAAGVHFFADDWPRLIAKKALRVNISDLVAKGATPVGYLLTLGLEGGFEEKWVAGFAKGLGEDQAAFGIKLLGGDTFKAPGATTIAITGFGITENYCSRLGAKPGDHLFVTGTIGDAALGLKLIKGEIDSRLVEKHERKLLTDRYHLPQPAFMLARAIGESASASMDISDGLVGDLEKLCHASKTGARVESDKIPLSSPVAKIVQAMPRHLETALCGGDDYELLFAISPENLAAFDRATRLLPVTISKIGVVKRPQDGIVILDGSGLPLNFAQNSYQHF